MPIYEYQCANCGKSIELLQKVSEPPARDCPECGTDQLKRKVSATRFQLKGTGWYVTDFKNQNNKGTTESKTTNEKTTDSDTSKKTSGEDA